MGYGVPDLLRGPRKAPNNYVNWPHFLYRNKFLALGIYLICWGIPEMHLEMVRDHSVLGLTHGPSPALSLQLQSMLHFFWNSFSKWDDSAQMGILKIIRVFQNTLLLFCDKIMRKVCKFEKAAVFVCVL